MKKNIFFLLSISLFFSSMIFCMHKNKKNEDKSTCIAEVQITVSSNTSSCVAVKKMTLEKTFDLAFDKKSDEKKSIKEIIDALVVSLGKLEDESTKKKVTPCSLY